MCCHLDRGGLGLKTGLMNCWFDVGFNLGLTLLPWSCVELSPPQVNSHWHMLCENDWLVSTSWSWCRVLRLGLEMLVLLTSLADVCYL